MWDTRYKIQEEIFEITGGVVFTDHQIQE